MASFFGSSSEKTWQIIQGRFHQVHLILELVQQRKRSKMKRPHQGEILPVSNFREILRLYDLGYNQSEISRSCLVARSTVQDYIRR